MNTDTPTSPLDDILNNEDYDNLVATLKRAKASRDWTVDMLIDCEFDWAAAAAEELDRRAAKEVLADMTVEDLMAIATQEISVNEIYRAL